MSGEGGPHHEVSVSVVIPSVGRPELAEAVASALHQTRPPLEVIIVFDADAIPDVELPRDPRVRIIVTGGGRGSNGARELGVNAARGNLVAFLDDDDYWRLSKLERQVRAYVDARARGVELVVATAAQTIDDAGRELEILPWRPPAEGQSVTDYLFRRRFVRYGESMLSSSMLLCSRALLEAVPLDTRLSLHEDWDWLIRATSRPGVQLLMVREPLLVYRRQAEGNSLSRSGRWRDSRAWFEQRRGRLSTREYTDGLLTVTLPLAVAAGDRRAAWSLLRRGIRCGPPGPPALLFALLTLAVAPKRLARVSAAARRLPAGGARRG